MKKYISLNGEGSDVNMVLTSLFLLREEKEDSLFSSAVLGSEDPRSFFLHPRESLIHTTLKHCTETIHVLF